jgi:hypothetical protein
MKCECLKCRLESIAFSNEGPNYINLACLSDAILFFTHYDKTMPYRRGEQELLIVPLENGDEALHHDLWFNGFRIWRCNYPHNTIADYVEAFTANSAVEPFSPPNSIDPILPMGKLENPYRFRGIK